MGVIKFGEIFVPMQSMSIERNFYPAKILCYTVHVITLIPIPVCFQISGPVVSKWARLFAVLSNWLVHTAFSNVSAYSRAYGN